VAFRTTDYSSWYDICLIIKIKHQQMKKAFFLLTIGLILILSSCEKHKNYDTTLIGKWQWTMTEMLGGNARYTSESVDSTYFIEFNSDGYRYLYNNSNRLVDKQKYELVNGQIFKFGSETMNEFGYSIEKETLAITNKSGFIIWTSYYTRLK
jgi:hypothetical protein